MSQVGENVLSDVDQVFSNLSRQLEIRSGLLIVQREKYERKAWGQLEKTHRAVTLELSRNSGARFVENFE